MEFGTLPHSERHVHAGAMGIITKQDSWKRIVTQVRDSLKDPQWKHADLVGDINVTLSAISHRIELC